MGRYNECQLFVSLLIISVGVSQGTFCSEDDSNVHCVPCNFNPALKQFRCPDQCNNQGKLFCKEVCHSHCINNQCKYEYGSLKCTKGCIGGLTGKYCLKICPSTCARCDQFTGECPEKPTAKPLTMHTSEQQRTRRNKIVTFRTTRPVPSAEKKTSATTVQREICQKNNHILIIATVSSILTTAVVVTATTHLIRRRCSKRGPATCDAFYLRPLRYPKADVWYCSAPIGRQTLAGFVKRLCCAAGFQGFFTNHSLRATAATRLYENGVDEQLIAERTGHRSTAIRGHQVDPQEENDHQRDHANVVSQTVYFTRLHRQADGSQLYDDAEVSQGDNYTEFIRQSDGSQHYVEI